MLASAVASTWTMEFTRKECPVSTAGGTKLELVRVRVAAQM